LSTALCSAVRSTLEDADGLPDDVAALAGAGLAGAELDEELPDELDEHAASMSAAAVIASADAMRLARGVRDAPRAPPPGLKPCL
jgi:hypothetical protein